MIISSKFEGRCRVCGGIVKVGDRVVWTREIKGVAHVTPQACAAAPKFAPKAEPVTANAKPMADFLNNARDNGKKFPTVSFLGPNNVELTMKLAGPQSKNPGAVFVLLSGNYTGSIAVDGTVRGALANNSEVLNLIASIATDPVAAAKAYAVLTENCSFCGKKLTDEGSIDHGYGPRCADRFNLPYKYAGHKKTVAVELAVA